jgi:hypothetical protein
MLAVLLAGPRSDRAKKREGAVEGQPTQPRREEKSEIRG